MKGTIFLTGLVVCFLRVAFGETELIVNGGFELANSGEWHVTGAGAAIISGSGAYNGVGYLSMGNVASADQVAFQTVTLPTNLVGATLRFAYSTVSSNTTTNNDLLSVYLLDTNQSVIAFFGRTSNTSPTSGYNLTAANLADYIAPTNASFYAGRPVEVYFRVTTDSILGSLTTFRLDNVSLLAGTTDDVPPNNDFAQSIALPPNSTAATATNTYASKETGEPNHAGDAGGHSVWWNWTAPAFGTVTISTSGSTFTTLLGVYTGSSVSNLTTIASKNGKNVDSGTAQVTFNVTPGTQYQIAVDGYSGLSGKIALNLKFSLDTKAPTVSITSPASGAKLTNSTVIVQGKASDSVAVALVEYRLENAAGTNDYQAATGTNTWSATITDLIPGPNTIRVRATDTSGNPATATRPITFIIVSPLTLTVSGSGTVTPNLNGQLLAVGSTYTVTAKPNTGNTFTGWTGDLTANAAKLPFTMQSNLVLHANFIPNPFIPVAGVYQGLFYDTNGANHQSSGFLNAKVTSTGRYSAKILLAGVSYSLSGQFSATGASSNSIALTGLPGVAVQLQLDLGGAGLGGQLSNGTWTAELNAFRAVSNPTAGKYTLRLPGGDGDPTKPGGDGFGTVTVDSLGRVSFAGTLGDGTKLAQKTILTPGGQWPFYVPLYTGKGSILGWLAFSNQADSDITGPVSWFKLPQPGRFYAAGFTNQMTATGSTFRFTSGVPVLDFVNGQVWLANGNLASSFTNQITLNSANKVTNLSSNALTLTIATTSGLFKGSVVNPATGKPIVITGVVLQKQNYGGGFFLGTDQVGRVYFGP